MFEGSKCLVTGGAGLLGTNLTSRLRRAGAEVTATFHTKLPLKIYPDVNYKEADLTEEWDAEDACKGMDYVFMAATVVVGAKSMELQDVDLITPNTIIQLNLLNAAYKAKVKKCLFLGSTTAYAESKETYIKEDTMFDGDPYYKYFDVGWYKRYGEKLCQWYSQMKRPPMPCVVVRPSNAYGPYDKFDPNKCHVTPTLIRRAVERQNPLPVWGDGEDVRDLIFIDDLIDGIFLAMEKIDTYNPIHIATGKCYSVNQILSTILAIENFQPTIEYQLLMPQMIQKRFVDTTKARELLGFEAKTSLESGLRQTIDWFRKTYVEA